MTVEKLSLHCILKGQNPLSMANVFCWCRPTHPSITLRIIAKVLKLMFNLKNICTFNTVQSSSYFCWMFCDLNEVSVWLVMLAVCCNFKVTKHKYDKHSMFKNRKFVVFWTVVLYLRLQTSIFGRFSILVLRVLVGGS